MMMVYNMISYEFLDPRYVWFCDRMNKAGMKDIHQFYVEVSNLTSFMVRHYAMVNECIDIHFYH